MHEVRLEQTNKKAFHSREHVHTAHWLEKRLYLGLRTDGWEWRVEGEVCVDQSIEAQSYKRDVPPMRGRGGRLPFTAVPQMLCGDNRSSMKHSAWAYNAMYCPLLLMNL